MKQALKLTDSVKLGGQTLKNRIAMAPMTRCRGDPATGNPTDIMIDYYTQRAGFGLIITECSQISPLSNAFPGSAGIYTKDQANLWKKIVDSVHEKEGKIYLQIWHSGRAVPSEFIGGQQPIAPSPLAIRENHVVLQTPHPVPKEMSKDDIKRVLEEFEQGAINAKEAGFDGIQLHGANGYLVEQFLHDSTNKRVDEYGGSVENRSRFMLEAVDVLSSVFGSERVAVRLSPTGRYNDVYDSDPISLMKYALGELSKKNLSFVEFKRHEKKYEKSDNNDKVDSNGNTLPQYQIPDYFGTLRKLYQGILIGNTELDIEGAQKEMEKGNIDIASFASLAISNPDLPYRIQKGFDLNRNIDFSTLFQGGQRGYTDYQNYQELQ